MKNRGPARSFPLPEGVFFDARNRVSAVELLEAVPDRSAALAFLDPQYRTGLDRLKYGNEGSRQKARYNLPQMKDDEIAFVAEECARALRPSGHLVMWCDKFAMGSGAHARFLRRCPGQVVDLLAWHKLRIGMGRRLRCVTEYAVVFQKPPVRAKGVWTDHSLPDCWTEAKDSERHAHAKPHVLTERLIRACTRRGDLVLDPCAGGYVVLDACQLSGRRFLGGDLL